MYALSIGWKENFILSLLLAVDSFYVLDFFNPNVNDIDYKQPTGLDMDILKTAALFYIAYSIIAYHLITFLSRVILLKSYWKC